MTRARAIRPTESEQPTILYHYTSVEVLEKIVTDKEIWSSSVHYLNDGREFAHALDIFDRALGQAIAANSPSASNLKQVRQQLVQNAWRDVFVTSFSEEGDLLSQWRAYCPAGRGISIGFHKAFLESSAIKRGFRLLRCKYDQFTQKHAAKEKVRLLTVELDEMYSPAILTVKGEGAGDAELEPQLDAERPYTADDVMRDFVMEFASIGPQMKDPAFAEEREWRLVGIPSDFNKLAIRYRAGTSYLVPYLRFPLLASEDNDLVIAELILGPTPHPELSKRAIVNLLANRHVRVENIRSTKVPYRSW
jgi:DUF2971 family protein